MSQSWDQIKKKLELITETEAESAPQLDEIDNVIKEAVDLARQMNLEVDTVNVLELLMEMREQEQNIEEPDSLNPVMLLTKSPYLMVSFLTEDDTQKLKQALNIPSVILWFSFRKFSNFVNSTSGTMKSKILDFSYGYKFTEILSPIEKGLLILENRFQ